MAHAMFSPQQRQESFSGTRKIAKTPTSKYLTVSVKWPHPKSFKATPHTLADAGFHWHPNPTAKDNVACFFCNENFSDWEEHHDPHVIHYDRCGESCAWAIARCGILAVDSDSNLNFKMGNDPDRLPCGKVLESNRFKIFKYGDWPHDKTRGHAVTSRKVAGAGFLFSPHEPGDDTAKCFYCGIELSGWDPEDDPVEEHRRRITKRGTECPFFTARITELPEKKKAVRKTTSKASLQTQKTVRTRSTKVADPEPDSDDKEDNLGRSTRSRTAKATKTPARAPARSTAGARSRATSSVAETDEPSGSDAVEETKPKTKGSKRKARDETPAVEEEDESEGAVNPLRKSTRAKKTRDVFEDIEVDVNFEESRPRQAPPRRSTRARSKAPTEGSDSDVSIKSARSTRSTKSTKSTRSVASKSKGKGKAQPVVEEDEDEEDMATPVQPPKKSTRSIAPPKSTKGRKFATQESVESESSEIPPTPPPRSRKSIAKSRKRVIESESEDWQSAREDVAPTPKPSTTKKARGRPPKVTKTPKAPPKPSPVPPSPTPTPNPSRVSGSDMSESELHIPADSPKPKKPTPKATVKPFHEKPSNRDRVLAQSRNQPLTSSRLLSIGSKENADDRNAIIIDASDDEDDTRRFVTSKSTVYNSTSSNPPKVNDASTDAAFKLKSTMAKKRDSFIGVVLSSSPRVMHQSIKARGKVADRSGMNTDTDEVMVLDQPSRSAETDRDSPVVMDKGKAKVATAPAKPKPPPGASKQSKKAVVQSEASDSAMDVDDHDDRGVHDVQSSQPSQPSTPRRDPPRKQFGDDSNPFTTVPPQLDSNNDRNPLSVFEAPYGRVPAEVIYALAEEEKEMTVEEWTKRELEIQLELFKEHGLRKIREFKERAAEARRQIEAL